MQINTNREKYEYAGGGRYISKAFLANIMSGGKGTPRKRKSNKKV